jgi:DMSO/TMAO reductase YedYZ molybdopterin-dependent catalytic subunit
MGTVLPPGQRAVDGFPRFGTHLHRPPPPVPADPVIDIGGAVRAPSSVPLAALATLPRRELTADFHCVAGWSATGLRWEGVSYAEFHRAIVEPLLAPGTHVTHLVFAGLDGYRSAVTVEDALDEDVLLADRLDGRPLDGDHGAPVRLLSPKQYGFVSTKHLCRVEVRTAEPAASYRRLPAVVRVGLRLATPHPRARVWEEERHRDLPAWAVRPVYRLLIAPIRSLSARSARSARSGRPAGARR